MFPVNLQNPSFYRNHPYKNQYDIPNSGFKNRQIPNYYSQIPKGKQFFQPTNKKHFQNKSHRSEIQQDNVFQTPYSYEDLQRSKFTMDKTYFRSLNVDDIQGAKPNTLISKAVKNRQKAHTIQKNQQKNNHIFQANSSSFTQKNRDKQGFGTNSLIFKQDEAINKFKKNKSILQNNSFSVLNNNYQKLSSYPRKGQQLSMSSGQTKVIDASNNYHFKVNDLNKVRRQMQQKQRRIRQLQKQLEYKNQTQYKRHTQNIRSTPNNYERSEDSYLNNNKHGNQGYHTNQRNQPIQQYPIVQRQSYKHEYQNNSKPNSRSNQNKLDYLTKDQLSIINQNNKFNQQLSYQINTNNQNTKINQYNQYNSYQNDINAQKGMINSEYQNKANYYQQIDRNNIRKYNPTFLSYESQGPRTAIGNLKMVYQ